MKKKFLNFMLFGAFVFALSSSFVGCSNDDYDDADLKASIAALTTKVDGLQTAVTQAQTDANAAKTEAAAALAKAEQALASGGTGGVTEIQLQEAVAKAQKDLQDQIDKLASLDAVDAKLAALKDELSAGFVSADDLKALAAQIESVSAELMAILGSRLTSVALIPTVSVNGIEAIVLTTLQYTPQVYQAMPTHLSNQHNPNNRPYLDHVGVTGASVMSISTDYNEAYFFVNPNLGVTNEDIELPVFEAFISRDYTRANVDITENSPIAPVSYDIDGNVLTVKYKKTIEGPIPVTKVGNEETFYRASLRTPIAPKNYTDEEKKAYDKDGTKVYVNSESYRLHETVKVPYLANSRTMFNEPMTSSFADETQTDTEGTFYVHYHDSVCVYESLADDYIDVFAAYDEPLDLKKLVTVCVTDEGATNHTGHQKLANYKDYGLAFRFYIPQTPYNTLGGQEGNTNKTDQQKFASIDSPVNGIMTSKVYTIEGANLTSVGREPIVRVDLIDEVNNNLIAIRYLKVKWVRSTKTTPITVQFTDSIYSCPRYMERIGTQWMNEKIYAAAIEGGMTKDQFHRVYTQFEGARSADGDGEAAEIVNNESGVDSYNITWTLTHNDVVTKYPVWKDQEKMDFEKVVYYKDPSGSYATLAITLKRTIYKPVFNIWNYDGRYWRDGSTSTNPVIFNINAIVYNTIESNPAWASNTTNNPTANIYTDLLNGYLDDHGVKPTTGAGGAIYYTDKERAGNNFYYSAFYPNPVAGSSGVKAGTYSEPGVRFIFDAEKLAADEKYIYKYFNGTTVVDRRATVSPDGTKLYIDNVLAATIENYEPNRLNASEMTYNIKLEEANPTHAPRSGDQPTEAAKAIVGEYVPVKMIANLCGDSHPATFDVAHTPTIKEYEAFIIEPVSVKEGTVGNFTDAVIGGSKLDVKDAFTYLSWNADGNGNRYPVSNRPSSTTLERQLWEFYEVVEGEWMTTQIKSNLRLVNGVLSPVDGVTDGPLPSNTSVTYDPATEELIYDNYSGTPVNWDYKLYIPVKFGYKWKTFTKTYEVVVKKNAGTPTR